MRNCRGAGNGEKGGETGNGIDNKQLEQLVGKKIELYDSRKPDSLVGVLLDAPPGERCQYAVVYHEQGEFKYRLLPAHLLSLATASENTVKMGWEFVEMEGRYIGNRTFQLGLKALFEKAGVPV